MSAAPPAPRLAYAAWAAVCVLWGTTYLAIRIALETVPPFLMGGFRWTAAGALVLGVLAARGVRLPGPRTWPSLALLGALFVGAGNGGVVWAEQVVPSGLAALLVATVPFWMLVTEPFGPDPAPVGLRRLLGLGIGFAGIVLLVWPDLRMAQGRSFLFGVLATQLACAGWAAGSTIAKRSHIAEHVMAAAGFQQLFGGLMMLALGLATGEWAHLAFTPRTAGAVAYLFLFGSIAGFSAYTYALRHLPATFVSLYAYVNPVIAMVLGAVVLGEPLGPRVAVAGAVVLVGMVLVRK